jgi:hypothetical protein
MKMTAAEVCDAYLTYIPASLLVIWTCANTPSITIYQECRLLWYKNPVRTSQETHYVSATEPSRLMLCKIWGIHGGDYEDCRLLANKNPVPTSQETHYVSATEFSQLMLCKIWCFHEGGYERCRLLVYKNPVCVSLLRYRAQPVNAI